MLNTSYLSNLKINDFLPCHVFLHYHRRALVLYTKHQQGEYFRKATGIFQNVKEGCLSLF
jgi:hypothetical protein